MNEHSIERSFKDAVCEEIGLSASGLHRFVVHVPFTFDDGDHYTILLKRDDDSWVLSDEGHTFMHLSYDVPEFDRGNRRAIIDNVLASFGIADNQGVLELKVPEQRYGDALFSFVQAITKITDVSFLSRERVRSTFSEDFRDVVTTASIGHGTEFDYSHPEHDLEKRYAVDARVNGNVSRQLLVFGIGNDEQCRDATIIINRWESWGETFHSLAVYRDQTEINRLVQARFSDVVERQYSTLDVARERLEGHLADVLGR